MKDKIIMEIESIKQWFNKERITIFLLTFAFGFVSHILIITSNIAVQDSLWLGFTYSKPGTWEVSLGRWGIILVERLNNFVMIPSIVTVMGLIILSISAVFICDIFELKKKSSKLVTAFAIVVSPNIYITFLYVHTALAYCMAFLFSTLSIWFIYRYKNKRLGYIFGVMCFTLTLSVYQSYIGIMIGVCIMYNVVALIRNKDLVDVIKNVGTAACVALIGAIIYWSITTIIFNVMNITLSSYMGASNISLMNIIINLKDTICCSYVRFVEYFIKDNLFYNTNYRRDLLWIGCFIIFLLSYVYSLIINFPKQKILHIAASLILLLTIPIGLNFINILVGHDSMFALTTTQMILIVPFIMAITEELKNLKFIHGIEIFVLSLVIVTFYISGNASYEAMKLSYSQSLMTTERIINRIENLEEYEEGMPVVFAGIIDNENFDRPSTLYNYTLGTAANNSVFHGDYEGQKNTWIKFLEVFFGTKYPVVSNEWYRIIVESDIFKEMDVFPMKNSVKVVHGAVVVKLKENPVLP